jgi:hypothetical protein
MSKSKELNMLEAILLKARRRLSDEVEDAGDTEDVSPEEAGMREFDPETEGDDADKWLEENEPKDEDEDEENEDEPNEYDEYSPDEDEESHQREPELDEGKSPAEGLGDEPVAEAKAPREEGRTSPPGQGNPDQVQGAQEAQPAQEVKSEGRFPQPTREDMAEMRQYTRPWEQRARDKTALEAEASKNPVLHRQGKMIESRNMNHGDRQQAYQQFQSSPEYSTAGPTKKMRLDAQFDKDWQTKNPDYIQNSMEAHGKANQEGQKAKAIHAAAKDEAIRHVLTGGAQGDTGMSTEEAMQHAGGIKGEEGTSGSMTQDPSSSFAAGNKAFLDQYAKDYNKKAKKPKDVNEMMDYDEGSKADVQRVLGEHPALKDPKKKAKVDAFFAKYHPLIGMNAQKVLNKLGLDSKRGDIDLGMLHEAGMHGLMQSINDYNHDHPSKASFSTHASNKIRGLQQTAMRSQDQIPQELRAGAKNFNQQNAAPVTKPDIKSLISKHPPDVADRMNRIDTFKQASAPKMPKPEGGSNE